MATVTKQTGRPKPRPKPIASNKRQAGQGLSPPKKNQPPARSGSRPTHTADPGFFGTPAVSILAYGPSGVGKTSCWSYMPKPMFIVDPQEEGIETLVDFGQACEPVEETKIASSFEEAMELLADAASGKWDIQSLILDSATGFEKLCFRYHCDRNFEGNWTKEGFYAFQQGPKNAAKTDWPDLLDAMDSCRRAGINVVLIAHSQVKSFNNPEGSDYDQYIPYLDKETWAQTHRWAQAVIFHNYDVALEKKGLKTKAKIGEETRYLYTTPTAAYHAKNRWGLESLIDAGNSGEEAFENFKSMYLSAYKKGRK